MMNGRQLGLAVGVITATFEVHFAIVPPTSLLRVAPVRRAVVVCQ